MSFRSQILDSREQPGVYTILRQEWSCQPFLCRHRGGGGIHDRMSCSTWNHTESGAKETPRVRRRRQRPSPLKRTVYKASVYKMFRPCFKLISLQNLETFFDEIFALGEMK